MPEITITGTLVKSRAPGTRGGVVNTLTDPNRTHSITWIDYENFHVKDQEFYKNVTVKLAIDDSKAMKINPGSH